MEEKRRRAKAEVGKRNQSIEAEREIQVSCSSCQRTKYAIHT
jgi:hypothetical protein